MTAEKLLRVAADCVRIYLEKHVSRAAAALSYFLMLSIFPTFICLYEMLGNMFPTVSAIREFASGLLPQEMLETIVEYLGYVTENRSSTMLFMAIIAMVTTASAAFRVINNIMGEIRGRRRFAGAPAVGFSFVFSMVFLTTVYFAVIVMVTGSWFISFVGVHLRFFSISHRWHWVRFLMLFLVLFVILLGIYRLTAPRGRRVRVYTGAVISSAALVGVSILFSHFISLSVRYPLVYGSLASVMILLFWLYLCGNIVIAGNIVNVILERG